MDKSDISVCAGELKLEMIPQTFRVLENRNCCRLLALTKKKLHTLNIEVDVVNLV